MAETHRILLQNERRTPLGRLRLAGEISGGSGANPTRNLRVYGSYAVVALTGGRGAYRDTETHRVPRPVTPGDVFLVFPEHPHWYGPARHQTWDELYLTFDGPVFDLWRQAGLFTQTRPVLSAPPAWTDRFRQFLYHGGAFPTASRPERMRQLLHFLTLLNELLLPERGLRGTTGEDENDEAAASETARGDWAGRARALLERDLNRDLPLGEVAEAAGMGYETFRKRFVREVGVSPAQYRAARKMEAARALLHYSPHLTNRQAAETLGFADEFHFSKQFSRVVGMSPRDFRKVRGGRPPGGETNAMSEKANEANEKTSVTIKRLQTVDEIAALRVLRGQVLRANQPPEAAYYPDDFDETTYHIGAVENGTGRVVGIATLLPNKGIQLRGMAVAPDYQKTGVGRLVLEWAHQIARDRNLPLWCNARVSAMGFYEKGNWQTEGDEFDVPNVGPHYVMRWGGPSPQPPPRSGKGEPV